MAIIRWDPFGDLLSIQEKMNRLFEDSLTRSSSLRGEEDLSSVTWIPPVDIYETSNEIILKAELPEVRKEDVEIKIDNNVLTLTGERKFEKETKNENYHRVERSYGSFRRSFTLPATVDQDKVKATFSDGVLKIVMTKKEEMKPRSVAIEVK